MGLDNRVPYSNPVQTIEPDSNTLQRWATQPPLGIKLRCTDTSLAQTVTSNLGPYKANMSWLTVEYDPYSMFDSANDQVNFKVPGLYLVEHAMLIFPASGAEDIESLLMWQGSAYGRTYPLQSDTLARFQGLGGGNYTSLTRMNMIQVRETDIRATASGGVMQWWFNIAGTAAVACDVYLMSYSAHLWSRVLPGKY